MDMIELPEVSLQSFFQPLLATQSELQRLAEIENQLTELEDFLEDHGLVTAVHTTTNIRHQIHTVKLHLKLQFTIQNPDDSSD